MTNKHNAKNSDTRINKDTAKKQVSQEADEPAGEDMESLKKATTDLNDKYLRLYADFENYKKTAARNREDLLKYANESIMSDILTVIDHLELALQHSSDEEAANANALAEGVNLTLKELRNVLEKHGLTAIESVGKSFDPNVHHAISQIVSGEADDNTVIKEFRKGYMLKDRVLRAAMVGVAKRNSGDSEETDDSAGDRNDVSEDTR